MAGAQEIPALTQPVNDFANVLDPSSEAATGELIRSLQQASGDVVVVATIETFAPYADLREYAVKMFENGGRGIGQRGKDNGLLVVVAVTDRQVWIEVGYDLEEFITDGFAGETSRQFMAPEFRRGAYGAGVLAGVSRLIARIAERRNVTIQGVRPDPTPSVPTAGSGQAGPDCTIHTLRRDQRHRRADTPWQAVPSTVGWHSWRVAQRRRALRWRLWRRRWWFRGRIRRIRRRPQWRRGRRGGVVNEVQSVKCKVQSSRCKSVAHEAARNSDNAVRMER